MKRLKGYKLTERDKVLIDRDTYFVCKYNPMTFSGKHRVDLYRSVYISIDTRDIVGCLNSLEFDSGYIDVYPLLGKYDFFKNPDKLIARPRIIKHKGKDDKRFKLHLLITFDIREVKPEDDKNVTG